MKCRRMILVTVSSLAVLSTALLTGCSSRPAAENTQTATEVITPAEEAPTAESTALSETGVLILSVNPEIQIDYDAEGKVTALTGRNEEGKKIAESCQDEIGKHCDEVLKNLITEIHSAGYFVEDIDGNKKNIVLQIEPGSVLPDDDFLESMSASTQNAVKGLSLSSHIVTVDDDDYDPAYASAEVPSPYITLEKAKEIALAQANVSAADAVFDDREFDHDDGSAIFELEFTAGGVEYEYDVDAVTGKVLKAEHQGGSQTQTETPASAPASTSVTNDDTDYGPNNDGVTDYNDTDYGPNNDGVTNYDSGNTNYDDGGTTNYDNGNTNYDDGGATNYDNGNTNYDNGGSSNYDDGGSNYSDNDDDDDD